MNPKDRKLLTHEELDALIRADTTPLSKAETSQEPLRFDKEALIESLDNRILPEDVNPCVYSGNRIISYIPQRKSPRKDIGEILIDPNDIISVLLNYDKVFPINANSQEHAYWMFHTQLEQTMWEAIKHSQPEAAHRIIGYLDIEDHSITRLNKEYENTVRVHEKIKEKGIDIPYKDLVSIDRFYWNFSVRGMIAQMRQQNLPAGFDGRVKTVKFHAAGTDRISKINPIYINQRL